MIIARNEEHNLPRCIGSLSAFDDILVVDDGSTDRTMEVASQLGAKVLSHTMKSFADQRNWAMSNGNLRNEWVIHLDADEVFTPELTREVTSKVIEADETIAGFYMARKTMLGERWLRHSATYPAWVPRIVRRNRVIYAQDGHGEILGSVKGQFKYLANPCLHYNFSKGWSDWFARHNWYSSQEAKKILIKGKEYGFTDLFASDPAHRRRALRAVSYRFPFRPFMRFFYVFILRRGFLDGKFGLTYSILQAIYEYMISIKVDEPKKAKKLIL